MSDFDPRAYWESALGSHFDLQGVGYNSLGLQYNRWMYRLRQDVFRRVLRKARIAAPTSDVLDVGCGTGFYVEQWRKAGARSVTGIDLTETSVARLRQRFPTATFFQGDIGADLTMLRGSTFDVVDAFDVLFHIVDDLRYRRAFINLAGALKPGGTLLFSDNFVHGGPARARHHVSRPLEETEDAVRAAGFRIEARMPMFVVMNEPADSNSALVRRAWSMAIPQAARHEAIGWAIGASLYPVDRILTRILHESPTTEVMVCRKA